MRGVQAAGDVAELGCLTSDKGRAGADLISMHDRPGGSDPFSVDSCLSEPLLPACGPAV